MSGAFTPSPWVYVPADDTPGYREPAMVRIGGKYMPVDHGLTFRPDEAEANARLIAEAPALLEALQECVKRIRDPMGEWDAIRIAAEKAERVIKRATGEAQS